MNIFGFILFVFTIQADVPNCPIRFDILVQSLSKINDEKLCPVFLNQSIESFTNQIIGLISPEHNCYVQQFNEAAGHFLIYDFFMVKDFLEYNRWKNIIKSQTIILKRKTMFAFQRCYSKRHLFMDPSKMMNELSSGLLEINRLYDEYLNRMQINN